MKRAALLVLALALPCRADIIKLADGREIEGEILSETADEVEIKIPLGSAKFPRSEIAKIIKKPSPEQEFRERRGKLGAKDVPGRIELAKWALEHKFPRDKGAELAVEAWRIEPGNEGSIELLALKLDYHYEKEVWLDAEHWYPTHGYTRRNGVFITNEEATYQDALALVEKLRAALSLAEADVKHAEDVIANAPEREKRAKKALDDATADQATIAAKKQTAKTLLDSREADLKAAVDRAIAARRDYDVAVLSKDPNRINLAQQLVNAAVLDEDRARRARNRALEDYKAISDAEDLNRQAVKDAQAAVDDVKTQTESMKATLPDRKAARDQAFDRLRQGEAAAVDARRAADARRDRDVKEAAARLDDLRAMKNKK